MDAVILGRHSAGYRPDLTLMSPLQIRGFLRRQRRHAACLALFLVLACAVAAHHLEPDVGAMGAAVACLAILGVVATVAASVGVARPRLRPPRLALRLRSAAAPHKKVAAAARAGPTPVVVLRR